MTISSPVVSTRQPALISCLIYDLLNPVVFGFFTGALIFDLVYFNTQQIFWLRGAMWMNFFALIFAVIPRLINLWQVWISRSLSEKMAARRSFWLNFLAIIFGIFNALVHSRDAWGTMHAGLILSAVSVGLLVLAVINDTHSRCTNRDIRRG